MYMIMKAISPISPFILRNNCKDGAEDQNNEWIHWYIVHWSETFHLVTKDKVWILGSIWGGIARQVGGPWRAAGGRPARARQPERAGGSAHPAGPGGPRAARAGAGAGRHEWDAERADLHQSGTHCCEAQVRNGGGRAWGRFFFAFSWFVIQFFLKLLS